MLPRARDPATARRGRMGTLARAVAPCRALARAVGRSTPPARRGFASTVPTSSDFAPATPLPVTHLLEEESMMRDATAQWAKDELAPLVRQMDDAGKMEPHIIQACFDSGFMGVEVAEEYGGCGSSFTAALLVVEELAKVDPSPR